MQSTNFIAGPSNTEATQMLTQTEQYILQQISSIVDNNNHQAEQRLQELYDKDGLQFMRHFFCLIAKCTSALEPAAGSRATQACLLYLRHFINKQKHRMPDLINQFITLYSSLASTGSRSLVSLCLRAYLSKPIHTPYTKDYLQEIAHHLIQQLQMDALSSQYLSMVVDTLSNLIDCPDYRPGLSMESQRMILTIVNNYALKKPPQIHIALWVETIVVLGNYSRRLPSCQFITDAMKLNQISIQLQTKLYDMFNRSFTRMANLQEMYHLIRLSINHLSNSHYLEEVEEQCGIQGVETHLKGFLNMLKVIVRCLAEVRSSGDVNDHMLASTFHEYQFFEKCVQSTLHVYQQHHCEISDLPYTIIYIFQELIEMIGDQKIVEFIGNIKETLKPQYIYLLMSCLPRNTMEIFSASNILVTQVAEILSNADKIDLAHNKEQINLMDLFLQFVLHYIAVYHYIEAHVLNAIRDLIKSFIFRLPETSPSNRNVLAVKAYGISIVCRLEKYCSNSKTELNEIQEKASNILSMSYELIEKIMGLQDNVEEIMCIIMDGLREFRNFQSYPQVVYEYLVNFFQHHLETNQQSLYRSKAHLQYLYTHFLKLLQQYFECLCQASTCPIRSMVPALLPILRHCLQTKNKGLQDQTCQFMLKILFISNSQHTRQLMNDAEFDFIYECAYNTGVYEFIGENFQKEDEDLIYCKILMETLANLKGCTLVENLLAKISEQQVKKRSTIVHNFDKVWEALVILRGVRNTYTQSRNINQRIDKIMEGSLQALLMDMNLDEQNIYKKEATKANKKINWSWLPDVRKVLEPGSVVGSMIELKLNASPCE